MDGEKPLVSVIVPVYRAEKTLREAVESAEISAGAGAGEGACLPVEILLIDDGSDDGSGPLCRKLEKEYDNVRTVRQPNRGPMAARLTGIREASGEFCMFLDADDRLLKVTLPRLIEVIKQYRADVILYNGGIGEGEERRRVWPEFRPEVTWIGSEPPADGTPFVERKLFLAEVIRSRRFNNLWLKAYRREILLDSPVYEDAFFIRTRHGNASKSPCQCTQTSFQ